VDQVCFSGVVPSISNLVWVQAGTWFQLVWNPMMKPGRVESSLVPQLYAFLDLPFAGDAILYRQHHALALQIFKLST
jgi:hypothetical protein